MTLTLRTVAMVAVAALACILLGAAAALTLTRALGPPGATPEAAPAPAAATAPAPSPSPPPAPSATASAATAPAESAPAPAQSPPVAPSAQASAPVATATTSLSAPAGSLPAVAAQGTLPCPPQRLRLGWGWKPEPDVQALVSRTLRQQGYTIGASIKDGPEDLSITWGGPVPPVSVEIGTAPLSGAQQIKVNPQAPEARTLLADAIREVAPACPAA